VCKPFREVPDLADEYVRRGQLQEAAREFQIALRIYPEYPEAVENYGLAEARMGNEQEARKLLETAVSLTSKVSPDYTLMKVNLAQHLMTLGQMEDALKLLNEAIADSPGYAPAWSSRAVIRRNCAAIGSKQQPSAGAA